MDTEKTQTGSSFLGIISVQLPPQLVVWMVGWGFERMVVVQGKPGTPSRAPNHQTKPPITGQLNHSFFFLAT